MSLNGFFVAAPQDDGDPVTGHYYEVASHDPGRAQAWGYSDKLSYAPGEPLALHAMSSAASVHMEILRDGLTPELLVQTDIPGGFAETPLHCSVAGCDWPERFRMVIPADWRSGAISFA